MKYQGDVLLNQLEGFIEHEIGNSFDDDHMGPIAIADLMLASYTWTFDITAEDVVDAEGRVAEPGNELFRVYVSGAYDKKLRDMLTTAHLSLDAFQAIDDNRLYRFREKTLRWLLLIEEARR